MNDVSPVFNAALGKISVSTETQNGDRLYHFDVIDNDFDDDVSLSIKGEYICAFDKFLIPPFRWRWSFRHWQGTRAIHNLKHLKFCLVRTFVVVLKMHSLIKENNLIAISNFDQRESVYSLTIEARDMVGHLTTHNIEVSHSEFYSIHRPNILD